MGTMDTLFNILILLGSVGVVWLAADILIDSVGRISRRYCKSGFLTAFFILGLLTSISEISVAVNSVLAGVPGVSVGNLIGASFVILLFIVPLLAVLGKGIRFNEAVSQKALALILAVVAVPVILVSSGDVTYAEGLFAIFACGAVAYMLYQKRVEVSSCDPLVEDVHGRARGMFQDIARVIVAGIAIFMAAHFLVEQAVYFAEALQVPASLIGLLVLSLGTNVPEIVVAVRGILRGRGDIALGDYLGSAVMNTLVFGVLVLFAGPLTVPSSEFGVATVLFIFGVTALWIFARSKLTLSRSEGAILLLFYLAFLVIQVGNIFHLGG